MQGEEEHAAQNNPIVNILPPDLYPDYSRDSLIPADENTESNPEEAEESRKRCEDNVAQVLGSEDPTRPTFAACSAINEANKKTDPSSSSRNREEEIPTSDQTMNPGSTSSRPLSASAKPWRPQDHPVANQIANVVPVSSDQRQSFGMQQQQQQSDNAASWRHQNIFQHHPVANYVIQQHTGFLIPTYPPNLNAAAPVWYNQQPQFTTNQQDPYQYPVANQMMPIHQAPPNYAPWPELNQQTQQPTQSQRFDAGSSSQHGQDQHQQGKPRGNDS